MNNDHIQKQTFQFLKELSDNNNRDWFADSKPRYLSAQSDFKSFIAALIEHLATFDPHIKTDIDPGRCMFRIYRDVRFSKNKDPYKTWLAAGISIDGRKLDGPEYYIHIEPHGKSFIAAGYWRPKKEHLDAIRQEIDYNAEGLWAALKEGGWSVEDLSTEDKLVRPPAGFNKDDPQIELLKLKSFIIHQPLPEDLLVSANALREVVDICRRIYPFKIFLHEAIDLMDE